MKAQVYHFQINVRDPARSLPFYKALLGYLEYRTVYETDTVAGFSGRGADIWVLAAAPAHAGSILYAAALLGIAGSTLASRMKSLGIRRPR